MQLIRGLHNIRQHHQGCAVTIGNFDGVHRGHVSVLNGLKDKAQQLQIPTMVMVFEPQPLEWLTPDKAPARLSTLADKITLLKAQGIDFVLCAYFKECLKSLPPKAFVQTILKDRLAARYLAVGDDFRFGCQCAGDFQLLKQEAGDAFAVQDTKTLSMTDERVSSTRIRGVLAAGEFKSAAKLLGYPYAITGRVIKGQQLGRTLNVPTANIALKRLVVPFTGVYIVSVKLTDGSTHQALANIGTRPTVGGQTTILETHLLDFHGDLYGKKISVEFIQKLRDEMRFSGVDELKRHIQQDINQAKQYFSTHV